MKWVIRKLRKRAYAKGKRPKPGTPRWKQDPPGWVGV